PTVISYNIVKAGDRYGTMYELLDAQDFLSVMENDKAHLKEHITRFAMAAKAMNEIKVDPAIFPSMKSSSIHMLPKLEGICTKEEIDKLRQLYESIPDRSTFIHGDWNPGSVMKQQGELMFIGTMTCGSGHPVFELTSMCSAYHMPPKFSGHEASPLRRNFTQEETDQIWDVYLRTYLDTDDEAVLKKAERQITAVASARMLSAAICMPGLIAPEKLEELKRTASDYVDEGLEPLVF
ncbi:MAG: phosphotransferase, partial [Solobacterium sp.]|nr:phosphotransferase [Solobacterium sp.]